jgi:hypothetical protein
MTTLDVRECNSSRKVAGNARTAMFSTARMRPSHLSSSSLHCRRRTMQSFRSSGNGGWLDVGKLGFGRKAAKLHIRMDSSAVSFPLSYSSSLVAPDLTLSIFLLRQMPAALISIGLEQSYRREPTAPGATLKSLGQARQQSSRKLNERGDGDFIALYGPFRGESVEPSIFRLWHD